jgi:hypothetical protein
MKSLVGFHKVTALIIKNARRNNHQALYGRCFKREISTLLYERHHTFMLLLPSAYYALFYYLYGAQNHKEGIACCQRRGLIKHAAKDGPLL